MRETANNAHGRWPSILVALGVDPKFLKNEHGPCPICHGKDRFRFDDKGIGAYFCSGCKPGDGFQLLQGIHGWDFAKAADEVDRVLGLGLPEVQVKPERTEEDKRKYMGKVWKESRPVISGDPVWKYLWNRCGMDALPLLQHVRFHPALKHSVSGDVHPAMVAGMGWDGKKFCGIHRTYLTEDGNKAPVDPVKMTFGGLGVIQLGPCSEELGIAEGIETAICASKRFGIPVWAAGCAGALEALEPPNGVKRVLIAADNDDSFTGQAAAFTLARRLRLSGLTVEVHIPDRIGTDWADLAGVA